MELLQRAGQVFKLPSFGLAREREHIGPLPWHIGQCILTFGRETPGPFSPLPDQLWFSKGLSQHLLPEKPQLERILLSIPH